MHNTDDIVDEFFDELFSEDGVIMDFRDLYLRIRSVRENLEKLMKLSYVEIAFIIIFTLVAMRVDSDFDNSIFNICLQGVGYVAKITNENSI